MIKFMLAALSRNHLQYQKHRDILEFSRILILPHEMGMMGNHVFLQDAETPSSLGEVTEPLIMLAHCSAAVFPCYVSL